MDVIVNMKILDKLKSSDNVSKTVYQVDKGIIELSHIDKNDGRDIICVPTMYYCKMGCKFCHMTNEHSNSFNMKTIDETTLLDTLLHFVKDNNIDKRDLLLSMMGVGEPTMNFEAISHIFCNRNRFDWNTHIEFAMATMFPSEKILQEAFDVIEYFEIPMKIYGSIHSVNDTLRKELIPNSNVSVEQCFNFLHEYNQNYKGELQLHKNSAAASIHYTIIDGVNSNELEQLKTFARKYPVNIKLIAFNETNNLKKFNDYDTWQKELSKIVPCSIYYPPGKEIGSSCGQLTLKYYLQQLGK
jgi:adenine C2-methylase RlmN of 23S rRNA A2503 and tRNA A37